MKPIKILLLAIALSFGGASFALADTSITVEVKDAAGNTIEGASVKIVDKDGNVVGEGTTGADGKYRRLYIGENAGQEFTVTVEHDGDKTETKQEPTGGKTRVNVAMSRIGGGSQAWRGLNANWEPIGGTDDSLYDDDTFGAVSAGAFVGRISVPASAFLGLEGSGGSNRRLGIVSTDETDRVVGASISGGFRTGLTIGKAKVVVGFGAYRWTADIEQEFEDIDPGGDDLLIPGPEGGASGFNLSGAGNLNTVTNGRFEGDYDGHGFKGKIGAKFPCGCGTIVTPFVGVRYASLETNLHFSGSVPGFARDFQYRTDVDVDYISPVFGVAASGRFGRNFDWIGWDVRASGAVDFNDAEGRDELSFTGFSPSSQKLENDDTTLSYAVGAGLRFGARSPFSARVGVSYSWVDNVPVVNRDGTTPSKLELEDADAIVGSIRLRAMF